MHTTQHVNDMQQPHRENKGSQEILSALEFLQWPEPTAIITGLVTLEKK